MRMLLCPILLLLLPALLPAADLPADQMLSAYVNAPDPAFAWARGRVTPGPVTVTDILLTSQTWHGTTWQHMLRVFRPEHVAYPGWMGLYVTGGDNPVVPGKPMGEDEMARQMAQQMQAPVAMLYQVPNQPLLQNLDEGEVINYSFDQYVKTGDPTWPVLFAMAKSGTAAMDALQQFGRRYWGTKIDNFVIMGGSKRGWSVWLTAAADRSGRVKAVVPIVFDVLDVPAQIAYARSLWGKGNEALAALAGSIGTPRGQALWTAVDPFTYRRSLTLPKLIMNATNDLIYTSGALNVYWDKLVGPKWAYYAPNSLHGMEQGLDKHVATMAAFFRTVATGSAMPAMSWQRQTKGDTATITIKAPAAKSAQVWLATASRPDFRLARYSAQPMTRQGDTFTLTVTRPADQDLIAFGQAEFEVQGGPCWLCTQPVILKR